MGRLELLALGEVDGHGVRIVQVHARPSVSGVSRLAGVSWLVFSPIELQLLPYSPHVC